MISRTFLSFLALVPLHVSGAFLQNWEGAHIDVSASDRHVDWWYTQIVSQTAAPNGIPPSIEVVLKHGNTFEYGNVNNTPLYSVEYEGFDLNGNPFGNSITFDTSSVAPTGHGLETIGTWTSSDYESIAFHASSNLSTFTITFNTSAAQGTIVINSNGHYRTGCGSTDVGASPFFNGLVSDGRPLTNAEVILYEKTGWRITAPGGLSTVDLTLSGTTVSFSGNGYKDSNWGPNAMNDFVRSWYVLIAEVGPFSFVSFTGQPLNGTNSVNSGHLSYNGQFLTSQCNIVGEQNTDIAIITPTGEVEDSDVIAPTGFNLTFVLANGTGITFLANNLAVNPSVSIYHRWVAKWTVTAGGQDYEGYGITEWMNTANLSHWELIQ